MNVKEKMIKCVEMCFPNKLSEYNNVYDGLENTINIDWNIYRICQELTVEVKFYQTSLEKCY